MISTQPWWVDTGGPGPTRPTSPSSPALVGALGIGRVPTPMREFVAAHMHPRRDVARASWQAALGPQAAQQQPMMDAALAAVRHPVLVLYGEEPAPGERRAADQIPLGTVEVWDGNGHWLPYVDVDRFTARVLAFVPGLDEVSSR